MQKIKIYTNHYQPEQFRINDIVEDLSKDNLVSVVTQIPNYPKGKWFPGYNLFKNRKQKIGTNISVRRLYSIPRGHSNIMLFLNYISYIISSYFYGVFHKYEKVDQVMVYITSPIFISWPAIKQARKQRVPISMYLLDLWPDNLVSILKIKSPRLNKWLERSCSKIYRKMDIIWISSLAFKERLVSMGVDESKIKLLPQHEIIIEKQESTHNQKDIPNVLFAGNIGEAQGLDLLIDIAQEMKSTKDEFIHFTIVGDGRYRKTLKKIVEEKDLSQYITLLPRVSQEELRDYFKEADYGLVILKDEESINRHLPAKVQSYMVNAVPILAIARDETKRIVNEANCGIVIEQQEFDTLFQQLKQEITTNPDILNQWSENGYKYAKANFDFTKIMSTIREQFMIKGPVYNNKVSIVMPMYNAEDFIDETLDSIEKQTYTDYEVLIVDDQSTDNSTTLVKKRMALNPKIKLHILEEKGGAAGARNYAIRNAQGRFIAFLDSDDLWDETKIEKQVNFMTENKIPFSYTHYRCINEDGSDLGITRYAPKNLTYNDLLVISSSIGCLTAMYDQNIVGMIQIPIIKKRNDVALWQRILKRGYEGYLVDEVLASHRELSQSLSRGSSRSKLLKHHYILYRENLGYNPLSASFFMLANVLSYLWIRMTRNKKK